MLHAGVHEFEIQHRTDLGGRSPTRRVPTARTPTRRRRAAYGRERRRRLPADRHHRPARAEAGRPLGHPGHRRPVLGGQGCDPTPTTATAPSRPTTGSWRSSRTGTGLHPPRPHEPGGPAFKGRTVYRLDVDGDAHSSHTTRRASCCSAPTRTSARPRARRPRRASAICESRITRISGAEPDRRVQDAERRGLTDKAAGDYASTTTSSSAPTSTSRGTRRCPGDRHVEPARAESGCFVPPATTNPVKPSQRGVLTNTTQVRGVVVERRQARLRERHELGSVDPAARADALSRDS